MEDRVSKVTALDGGRVKVSFYSGDIYEYDLKNISAVIPEFKVPTNPKDVKLKTDKDGDGFVVNSEIAIDIEEILDSGTFIEHIVPDLCETFGQMMIEARKKKGLCQTDLESLTGIYQTDISRYEHGIGNPTVGTMKKIAEALDIDLEFSFTPKKSTAIASTFEKDAVSPLAEKIESHFQFEFNKYINKNKGKCIVSNDLAILTPEYADGYIFPNLTVVCDPSKISSNGINGAPDFVLEILTEENNAKNVFTNKLGKYMSIGVREYWIIDCIKKQLVSFSPIDNYSPATYSFDEKVGMALFDGQLKIDFKQIQTIISEK